MAPRACSDLSDELTWKLHLLSCGLWTVLAVYADEERCDVLDLAKELRRDDPGEYARLMRAFDRLLDGVDHDEIHLDGQDRTELIEEAQSGVHQIVRMHGAELDEKVQVALSGWEFVEAFHSETSAPQR